MVVIRNPSVPPHESRIPRKPVTRISRFDWHHAYVPELIALYGTFISTIETRYPSNRVTWDSKTFNDFSRLMYMSSSRYISKNLDEAYEDNSF